MPSFAVVRRRLRPMPAAVEASRASSGCACDCGADLERWPALCCVCAGFLHPPRPVAGGERCMPAHAPAHAPDVLGCAHPPPASCSAADGRCWTLAAQLHCSFVSVTWRTCPRARLTGGDDASFFCFQEAQRLVSRVLAYGELCV